MKMQAFEHDVVYESQYVLPTYFKKKIKLRYKWWYRRHFYGQIMTPRYIFVDNVVFKR
jgi:hypothetical protein